MKTIYQTIQDEFLLTSTGEWIESYKTGAEVIYHVDADIYQDAERIRRDVGFVEKLVDLSKAQHDVILDLACGPGGHSIEMTRRFPSSGIIGLDYSPGFLKIAKARAQELSEGELARLALLEGDMRALQIDDASIDILTVYGNSLGFFTEEENIAVFREMRRVIKPGGMVVVNIADADHTKNSLKPYAVYDVDTPWGKVRDERWKKLNDQGDCTIGAKKHTLCLPDGSEEILLNQADITIYLYSTEQLREAALAAGFNSVEDITHLANSHEQNETLGLMSHTRWYVFRL